MNVLQPWMWPWYIITGRVYLLLSNWYPNGVCITIATQGRNANDNWKVTQPWMWPWYIITGIVYLLLSNRYPNGVCITIAAQGSNANDDWKVTQPWMWPWYIITGRVYLLLSNWYPNGVCITIAAQGRSANDDWKVTALNVAMLYNYRQTWFTLVQLMSLCEPISKLTLLCTELTQTCTVAQNPQQGFHSYRPWLGCTYTLVSCHSLW